MTRFLRCALSATALLASGCGGASTSPAPTPATNTPAAPVTPVSVGLHFTVSPVDPAQIIYITALGNMSPWGHTLPTDHIYFYCHPGDPPYSPVQVFAPAGGKILSISAGRVDVQVDSVYTYWVGPLVLADGIAAGATVQAGRLLGTHATAPAFDFSVLRTTQPSTFANPLRYSPDTLYADGPIQYFEEPARSAIVPKVRRVGGQLDGRINYDVAGTLSGNWYDESLAVADSAQGGTEYSGTRKLSFARDVIWSDRQRVSLGGLGMTGLFATSVDAPDWTAVTVSSGVVVLRMLVIGDPMGSGTTLQAGWLIVQMLDDQRIRIEAVPFDGFLDVSNAGAAPSAFTANARIYVR